MNIRVRTFKLAEIIVWWNDTKALMNCNICVMESIADIQYHCIDSMYIIYSNGDKKVIRMCYLTIQFIKDDVLNMKTTICTVSRNKFPFIIIVILLNTWLNEIKENLFSIREIFYWYGIRKNVTSFVHVILLKKTSFQNWQQRPLRYFKMCFGVR